MREQATSRRHALWLLSDALNLSSTTPNSSVAGSRSRTLKSVLLRVAGASALSSAAPLPMPPPLLLLPLCRPAASPSPDDAAPAATSGAASRLVPAVPVSVDERATAPAANNGDAAAVAAPGGADALAADVTVPGGSAAAASRAGRAEGGAEIAATSTRVSAGSCAGRSKPACMHTRT